MDAEDGKLFFFCSFIFIEFEWFHFSSRKTAWKCFYSVSTMQWTVCFRLRWNCHIAVDMVCAFFEMNDQTNAFISVQWIAVLINYQLQTIISISSSFKCVRMKKSTKFYSLTHNLFCVCTIFRKWSDNETVLLFKLVRKCHSKKRPTVWNYGRSLFVNLMPSVAKQPTRFLHKND